MNFRELGISDDILKVLKLFTAHNADFNMEDIYWNIILHEAVLLNNEEVLNFVIDQTNDINKLNSIKALNWDETEEEIKQQIVEALNNWDEDPAVCLMAILKLSDMQKNDIGIAMCHFELSLNEMGIMGEWKSDSKSTNASSGWEYVVSWIKQ